jgi:hypothetical protein
LTERSGRLPMTRPMGPNGGWLTGTDRNTPGTRASRFSSLLMERGASSPDEATRSEGLNHSSRLHTTQQRANNCGGGA